jgi:hypothetical protein
MTEKLSPRKYNYQFLTHFETFQRNYSQSNEISDSTMFDDIKMA